MPPPLFPERDDDEAGQGPPPQEMFSLGEQTREFVEASITMPDDMRALVEEVNKAGYPKTPIMELDRLIGLVTAQMQDCEPQFYSVLQAKLEQLNLYRMFHNPPQIDPNLGRYKDVL